MNWLDEMEARDPAYPTDPACPTPSEYSCPAGCNETCDETEDGIRCPACGQYFTWAKVAEAG
jgi:hypothetical protein